MNPSDAIGLEIERRERILHESLECGHDLVEEQPCAQCRLEARIAKQQARIEALEKALTDMCHQFAYDGSDDKGPYLYDGGMSALECAFDVLGWEDKHYILSDKCALCNRRASCGTPWDDPRANAVSCNGVGYARVCGEHFSFIQEQKALQEPAK